MLRQRIECIVLGAFLTPSVPCPETSGAARRHRCLKASTLNLRQIPFSGLLPSWSLSRWACDIDLKQMAQARGIWLTATNSRVRTHHASSYQSEVRARLPTWSRMVQGRSHKTGATMARTKKIIRREWTKDDVRQMKAMAKAKTGVKKIAKSLKRTPGATQVMAAKLGVSLSTRI